jgi:hypothetical protein
MTPAEETQAQLCLTECNAHIAAGKIEATIRSVFNSHLRLFAGTPLPWWATEHIVRTEAALKSKRGARMVTGFADNVVGLTAIEYEKDLNNPSLFAIGLDQVRDYMAGLLNSGVPSASVRGVLSDTVRWYAYGIASISVTATPGMLSKSDLTLKELSHVDCSAANLAAARTLHQFLEQNLGRDSGQKLAAVPLYEMFGVTSTAGASFLTRADTIVTASFAANPGYADMVQNLWADFVSFVGSAQAARIFDKDSYVCELYLLTLAKLIAVNVIDKAARISPHYELEEILSGQYFRNKGLTNFVEYDYFGWLTKPPYSVQLVLMAGDIQQALKAFDFSYLVPEDLFGPLVSQLAERTQRILLGQEATPAWLVREVVSTVEQQMAANTPRRYVDPCCGSGAFIVDILTREVMKPGFTALNRDARAQALCEVITGFDIDPMAVMFAKVSWLIAAQGVLAPFDGSFPTSIPIYHADSLFAITPLARSVSLTLAGDFDLELDGKVLTLPGFLAEPAKQPFFDDYVDGLYAIAQVCAPTPGSTILLADVQAIVAAALANSGVALSMAETAAVEAFGLLFSNHLTTLERNGRNGLWLHMLKNGYRPALVRGKFNAVVTNFPWLSLSKLANNPYKDALKKRVAAFNLKPPSQSALHVELASVFMMHAAKHYLGGTGTLGVVVPNSVFQGTHQEPLRNGNFRNPPSNIPLTITEVWDVDKAAFSTNVAAVLIAKKGGAVVAPAGAQVSEQSGKTTQSLFLSTMGQRTAWTSFNANIAGQGTYGFEQGVDLFPRTVWFHDVTLTAGPGGVQVASVKGISGAAHPLNYLVAQPKLCKSFRATNCSLSLSRVFSVLTSNQLVAFQVNAPALAVLPFNSRSALSKEITAATAASIALDAGGRGHFQRVYNELAKVWGEHPINASAVLARVDTYLGKLSKQTFNPGTYLVLFGAGGTYPCAARFDISANNADTLIVDQTAYWLVTSDVDEADFIVGLVNSDALAAVIQPFQPQGKEGARHLHSLVAKVLPQWDPNNQLHLACLAATKAIQADLAALALTTPPLAQAIQVPTKNVSIRRKVVRQALGALSSYHAYQSACANVI